MARYKVLKSVAHSLAHSFTSTLNYWDGDYVMGHLLRRARKVHEGTLLIDLLHGTAAPVSLCITPVARAVTRYSEWLPDLVRRHGSDMRFVQAATMTIAYNIGVQRPARYSETELESPYVCSVDITDDRGTIWRAELRDWWVPEPLHPNPPRKVRRRWWEFWKPAA